MIEVAADLPEAQAAFLECRRQASDPFSAHETWSDLAREIMGQWIELAAELAHDVVEMGRATVGHVRDAAEDLFEAALRAMFREMDATAPEREQTREPEREAPVPEVEQDLDPGEAAVLAEVERSLAERAAYERNTHELER